MLCSVCSRGEEEGGRKDRIIWNPRGSPMCEWGETGSPEVYNVNLLKPPDPPGSQTCNAHRWCVPECGDTLNVLLHLSSPSKTFSGMSGGGGDLINILFTAILSCRHHQYRWSTTQLLACFSRIWMRLKRHWGGGLQGMMMPSALFCWAWCFATGNLIDTNDWGWKHVLYRQRCAKYKISFNDACLECCLEIAGNDTKRQGNTCCNRWTGCPAIGGPGKHCW